VTGFTAPVAQSLSITGTELVGETMTANYTYFDAEGDLEGATTFQWFNNGQAIVGDTAQTHILTAGDIENRLTVHIRPITLTGHSLYGVIATAHLDVKYYFNDPRDNQNYRAITIGNYTWMGENLNYNAGGVGSVCYNNTSSLCTIYGRLYDFTTALTSCPVGWELPSDAQWEDLASNTDQNNQGRNGLAWNGVGKHLKTDTWLGGLDSYDFSALAAGTATGGAGFNGINSSTGFWTSTVVIANSTSRLRGMLNSSFSQAYLYNNAIQQTANYSVRCIMSVSN
jgi:uncharacterized protein (TIGR02145 family)